MKNFKMLLFYELKKVALRKSTWITLGALLLFLLFMECGSYLGASAEHSEGIKIDRQDVKHLSGRAIDDGLLEEFKEEMLTYGTEDESSSVHKEHIRPYRNLYSILNYFARYAGYNNIYDINEKELYLERDSFLQNMWEEYRLNDAEIAYWAQKEEDVEKPFIYEYAEGYANITVLDGIYIDCLLLTFFIAICVSLIFSEEHIRRTDQLVLCSRFGRGEIYFVRICAGSIVSFCAAMLLELATVLCNLLIYGAKGASALLLLWAPYYSSTMTLGQMFLIATVLLALISLFTTIFTMVLSELIHSSIGAMAVTIAILFLARLIEIPNEYRLPAQIWEYLPINLIKSSGLCDLRLVPFIGGHLTSWQFAPVLYAVLGVIFVLVGKKVYCRYQVSGR